MLLTAGTVCGRSVLEITDYTCVYIMQLMLTHLRAVLNWMQTSSWWGMSPLEWLGGLLLLYAGFRLVRRVCRTVCKWFRRSRNLSDTFLPPVAMREAALPEGGDETILVVDDESFALRINMKMIRKLGYQVHGCSGGRAAIEWLKKNDADLMVLDLAMPNLNGVQTLQRIRAFKPELKVVVLSGYARPAQVKELISMGVGAYLVKPAPLDTLGRTIRRELDMGSAGSSGTLVDRRSLAL